MDMRMTTLENGWTGVVAGRPSDMKKSGVFGFAAELNQAVEAAKQAEASQDGNLKAAYDRLSDHSKAVLSRLKAGQNDITTEEWSALRAEMRDAGLITQSEFISSDPDVVTIGYLDANDGVVLYPFAIGCTVSYTYDGSVKSGAFWGINWNGDPFQYLDQWLKIVRDHRENLELLALTGGSVYDTSYLIREIQANEKVSDLVRGLIELA